MPITYRILQGGHFIYAIAESPLTSQEFVDYEVAHAIDIRIKTPVSELFEIAGTALQDITMDDMKEVMRRRGEVKQPINSHRCAIVLGSLDDHSWNLAKFYEVMAALHSPETVIVFANSDVARKWIGFEDVQPNKPAASDGL